MEVFEVFFFVKIAASMVKIMSSGRIEGNSGIQHCVVIATILAFAAFV